MKTSCLIFMYNGQKYIEEQILSILNQTVFLHEIIIVDDCSSDDSVIIVNQLIDRYPNSNLILEKNTVNLGVIKTVEKGISLSTGELIFFSDQDDVWIENKVEVVLDYVKNNPKMDFFYTDGNIVDSELNEGEALSNFYRWRLYSNSNKRLQAALDLKNFIPGHSMIIRMDFLKRCLPIPSKMVDYSDGWFANMAHYESSSFFISERLIKYRQHDFNLVGTKKKSVFYRFFNKFRLGLWNEYIDLAENQYFELVNNYDINKFVKESLIIRYNYYNSLKKINETNRIYENHFLFMKTLLKSHIENSNYRRFINLLKLEINILVRLSFRILTGGLR